MPRHLVLGCMLTVLAPLSLATATVAPPQDPALQVDQRWVDLFTQAEEIFGSVQQERSISMFSAIIAGLERQLATTHLNPDEQSMLTSALLYRARARLNLGETEGTEEDLRRLIALDPTYELDERVSSQIVTRFNELHDEMIGEVFLILEPQDADTRLAIDGQPVDPYTVTLPLVAGTHQIEATHPGYEPLRMTHEVEGGAQLPLELLLQRNSAVVEIISVPANIAVNVNGQDVGRTEPPTGDMAAALPAGAGRLLVDGLAPGEVTIQLSGEGYRTRSFSVTIDELSDYPSGVIELSRAEASVFLEGAPEGCTILIDGDPVSPDTGDQGPPYRRESQDATEIVVRPGAYRVTVVSPDHWEDSQEITVADRDALTLELTLRPRLLFLGIAGGDRVGAGNLSSELVEGIQTIESWTLVDDSDAGIGLMSEAGLEVESLRRVVAEGLAGEGLQPAWAQLQSAADRSLPGSLYVLGVMSDDLVSTEATLWMWASALQGRLPDRVRVPLTPGDGHERAVARILESLRKPVVLERAWLGAVLMDSTEASHPVVVQVAGNSPAAASGIEAGDLITAVAGQNTGDAAELERQMATRSPGERLTFSTQRGSVSQEVEIELGLSPQMIPISDPQTNYAAIAAALIGARPLVTGPDWLLRLNEAIVFLNASDWTGAVNALRQIRGAPTGPGIGQAAVDYLLGLALERAGPTYADLARAAYERAAAAPGGRLFHNDGPFVAPRAKARLARGTGGS